MSKQNDSEKYDTLIFRRDHILGSRRLEGSWKNLSCHPSRTATAIASRTKSRTENVPP